MNTNSPQLCSYLTVRLSCRALSALAFRDMDADNCGVIRLDELLAYFHIKKTLLTEKLFEDKESKFPFFLNFEQFVVYTWQFLTLSLEKVATFAFHLLDTKKSGFLSKDTITYLMELMHNKTMDESKAIRKLVKQCGVLYSDEKLSKADFETFSERHRLLCDPFRRTQIAYQSKLLGRVIWKRLRLQREAREMEGEALGVEDDVADALLAKWRRERRQNTGLVQLEKWTAVQDTLLQDMMDESAAVAAAGKGKGDTPKQDNKTSKGGVQLQTEDVSDRIVLPMDGKVRAPKSTSLRRAPKLIPKTDAPKKKKKKKKRSFGARKCTSYSEHDRNIKKETKRRHSSDGTTSPPLVSMLKDINNVEFFKSSSLDMYDDDDDTTKKKNLEDEDPGDELTNCSPKINSKKQNIKECAVVPF